MQPTGEQDVSRKFVTAVKKVRQYGFRASERSERMSAPCVVTQGVPSNTPNNCELPKS